MSYFRFSARGDRILRGGRYECGIDRTADTPDPQAPRHRFTAELWLHDGPGGWHFLTLPADLAGGIRDGAWSAPRPFGSVPVTATIGPATWSTSLFADRGRGTYLLPVNAAARRTAGVAAGDRVTCDIVLGD